MSLWNVGTSSFRSFVTDVSELVAGRATVFERRCFLMVSRHSKASLSTSACMCMTGLSVPALEPRIMVFISFNSPFSPVFGLYSSKVQMLSSSFTEASMSFSFPCKSGRRLVDSFRASKEDEGVTDAISRRTWMLSLLMISSWLSSVFNLDAKFPLCGITKVCDCWHGSRQTDRQTHRMTTVTLVACTPRLNYS